VADALNGETQENLGGWLKEFRDNCQSEWEVPFLVLLNKIDLVDSVEERPVKSWC